MQPKTWIWIGVFVGSTVGSYIPSLWGAGFLSTTSMLLSAAGAFGGIWLGWRVSQYLS